MAEGGNGATSDESMKLAIAISLLRSKFMKKTKDSNSISPSQSETLLRWKRKVRFTLFFSKIQCVFSSYFPTLILRLRKGSKRFYASEKIWRKLKVWRGFHDFLLWTHIHLQLWYDMILILFFFLDADASHCDLFPGNASCKCYFFDSLGQLSPKHHGNDSNNRFNDVLRRRFLRQGFIINYHVCDIMILNCLLMLKICFL